MLQNSTTAKQGKPVRGSQGIKLDATQDKYKHTQQGIAWRSLCKSIASLSPKTLTSSELNSQSFSVAIIRVSFTHLSAFFSHQLLCLTTIPHFWLRRATKSSPLSFGSVPMITWQEAAWQWLDRHPPKETAHISHAADTLHTQSSSSTPREVSGHRQLLLIDHPKAAGFPVSPTAQPGNTYLLGWTRWHCHTGLSQVCLSKAKQQVMSREDWSPISSPKTNLLKGNSTAKTIASYLFIMIFLWYAKSLSNKIEFISLPLLFLKEMKNHNIFRGWALVGYHQK